MTYNKDRMMSFYRSMPYEIDEIIQALKDARRTHGLTQRGLSAKAGVPQSHISKIESGAVDIRLSSLIELARTLGLELMLVPRSRVTAVQAIVRGTDDTRSGRQRPAYALDDSDDDDGDE